jgi:DNA (cytosine-5)-methyltransferase 1
MASNRKQTNGSTLGVGLQNSSTDRANAGLIDIELFAGGGGMAVGLRQAGFTPANFYESNGECCDTLTKNILGKNATLLGKVIRGKTEQVDWKPFQGIVRLLAGGAPCQPFSLGGKHHAHRDERNLFPEVLRAVRETKPMAVLLENVRGIVRHSFRFYFEYVLRQLQFPSVAPRQNEKWRDHDDRLKKLELKDASEYHVVFRLLNAADFGVPQNRLRVFIVATRTDFPTYVFPNKTHSREMLENALHGKEYWERHGIARPSINGKNDQLKLDEDVFLPWVTVRDALAGLPLPASDEADAQMNHWIIPGARSYHGHTGSQMDWIGKTIKAGVHGVPGGENTLIDSSGKLRYFTLRETARIQSFPDKHIFEGARIHVTRQIGNAVPSRLAAAVATPLYTLISTELAIRARRRANG